MAYNKRYFLERVRKVNEIYLYWNKQGVPNEFIYKHYICEQFDISRATFYDYLRIPYKAQKLAIKNNQLTIGYNNE